MVIKNRRFPRRFFYGCKPGLYGADVGLYKCYLAMAGSFFSLHPLAYSRV